jgi:hypothetical protein
MTVGFDRNAVQERLLIDGVFVSDLAGYAASAAAADLLVSWETMGEGDAPLDVATRRSDVAEVVKALQEWAAKLT